MKGIVASMEFYPTKVNTFNYRAVYKYIFIVILVLKENVISICLTAIEAVEMLLLRRMHAKSTTMHGQNETYVQKVSIYI